ncbi:methylamine utilization protein [Methylosoma difficile]
MAARLPRIFLRVGGVALGLWVLNAFITAATADTLQGRVTDAEGNALADAVITAMPASASPQALPVAKKELVSLDQQGREFVPHVLVVNVGTAVTFPNSDDIQHHVYSFSDPKRFEIKLYKTPPKNPIVFDQPGIVALGCNIHDWMLGYVYITDAPYFTKSDAQGFWSLALPEGEYRLGVWHPDASQASALPNEKVSLPASAPLQHQIALKGRRQTGKPPSSLQEGVYGNDF